MTSANNGQILPPQPNPLNAVFQQYINCPQHRGIILGLSAIIQYITLLCPTALVWNNLGEGRSTHIMCASPLDLLPCPPSALPMPDNPQRSQIRAQLRTAENQIRVRGRGAEMKWSSDKCQQSTRGKKLKLYLQGVRNYNIISGVHEHMIEVLLLYQLLSVHYVDCRKKVC